MAEYTDTENLNNMTTPINITETQSSEFNIENWDDFDIKTDLLRGIYSIGFEKPSPIQKKAILPIIKGHDLIAQAQSGTGKTGTFSIGTLQVIDTSIKKVQAILMSPTHELATQTASVISKLGIMMDDLVIQTLIGGTSINEDSMNLYKNTPQVIVGTPGRIYDMIKREKLNINNLKLLVIDEADDMLSTGFKEQIYNIFQHLPNDVQVALFSATIPDDVLELTSKFMRNPVKITMKNEELNLECIQQYFVALSNDKAKYDTLKIVFEHLTVSQCIIYVNSIKRVIDLYNAMTEEGFSVTCLHSSMTKIERNSAFNQFKSGATRVLISSNITARGIDVQQVSVVINFDIPQCVHTYLHRIGRSGRWGRKGIAINFITRQDIQYMKNIENHYKSNIRELQIDNKIGEVLNSYR
jgi:translation initiation factor 4A